MAIESLGGVLGYLSRLFIEGTVSGLPDDQLLDRFLATRDGVAFELLMARHGPMVLRVCQAVLRPERRGGRVPGDLPGPGQEGPHPTGPRQPGGMAAPGRLPGCDPSQRRFGPATRTGEERGRDVCHDLIARSRHPG